MLPEDYLALKSDIEKNGYDNRHPIYFYEGDILDGWHRYKACEELGVKYSKTEYKGTDIDAVNYVMRTNKRRNLTSSQWACIATEAEELIEALREAARERQLAGLKQNQDITVSQQIDERDSDEGRTDEKVAETFNTNRQYIHDAGNIKTEEPELYAEVKAGTTTITKAKKKIRKKKQAAAKAAIKELALPEIKYETIVIDPPWPIEKILRDVAPNQVEFDYPTMTIEEITTFKDKIDAMADEDCHLFMWTTEKYLPISLGILKSWDYRYILTIVWHKSGGFQPFNLPQYNCEFVLYARKGTPEFTDTKNFFCCFEGKRREHSRKPDEFYEIIARVTPEPRIDIFSRGKHDGFDQYGNETGKF